MKQYEMAVDEATKLVSVDAVFKCPIAEGVRYERRRYDPRIKVAEVVVIKPYEEACVPVTFQFPEADEQHFISPVCKQLLIKAAYCSCCAINSCTDLLFINPTPHRIKIVKHEIVATYVPFEANLCFVYFNDSSSPPFLHPVHSLLSSSPLLLIPLPLLLYLLCFSSFGCRCC